MSDGVVLLDATGRVVFVNEAEVAICGYADREDMLRDFTHYVDAYEIFTPDGASLPPEQWPVARLLRGEEVSSVELHAHRKQTGQRSLFRFSGRHVQADNGERLSLLVMRDLTESRRAADQLQESERRFRDLANAMPQLVWMAREDGSVEYYNSRAAEYDGISRDEEGDWTWRPVTHPDDREATVAAWSRAVADRDVYVCEHRARMADGSFRWHLSRAIPVEQRDGTWRWYGTATDIHNLKTAEAALRGSEAKYRSLFESVDQGFCVLEIIFDENERCVDYRYLEMNRTFEEESGLKGARNRTVRELVPDLDDAWFEIYGEVARTGEPRRFENHAPAMNRWFDVYAFRLGPPEERKVAVLFKNTTERRRREANAAFLAEVTADLALTSTWQALMERIGDKLAAHLGLSRVAFAEVDERAIEATVLYSREEAGAPSALGTHALASFMNEAFVRELQDGQVVAIDDVSSDPRTSPLLSSYLAFQVGAQMHVPHVRDGRLVSLLAIYRDRPHRWRKDELELMRELTARLWGTLERARAEDALKDQVERFRLLGRATNDVIWDWDPSRDTLEWNDALAERYGHCPRTFSPTLTGWADCLHPNDRAATLDSLNAAIGSGAESWTHEYRFRRADGSYATVLDRGYLRRDANGRVVRMVGSMIDLTERKAAEAALKEAARQKDEFLAMLSHELRNPLAPIKNGVYVLSRAPGSRQAARALDIIDRQAVHMTRLIDDLLDVTRLSRGKVRLQRERLELGALLRKTVEDHNVGFANAGVTLTVYVPDDAVFVDGDPTRIAQMVGNLLNNAAKFTPPGGNAAVSLRAEEEGAVIEVRDDGAGIAPHVYENLFQPFVQLDATLDRSRGGLGLGLTLVKGLVEMHGGTVSVESPGLGQGSTFTLRLPLARAGDDAGAAATAAASARAGGLRVLVVDDLEDIADSLRDVLELDGHIVATASDGEAALEVARRFAPDVVICDIGLPGMDGYAVARSFREEAAWRESYLIALSGYAREQDVVAAREAGFDEHLAKPPDLERLSELLRDITR